MTTTCHSKWSGVNVPIPTLWSSAGKVDCAGVRGLCSHLIDEGCHGVFVAGSTGEVSMLDEDDRRALVSEARAACSDRGNVYAGVIGLGCKQTVRLTKYAAEDGADAAVVMAPFYSKLDQPQLVAFVRAIADVSPIPTGIYHHFRAATQFELDTVVALAEHPNIVFIKDSSMTSDRIRQLVQVVGERLTILQGREPFLAESFHDGANGCICALANIAPGLHRKLFDTVQEGDYAKAEIMQNMINQVFSLFQIDGVSESLANFVYVIKRASFERGYLNNTTALVPGFKAPAGIDETIHNILCACSTTPAGGDV